MKLSEYIKPELLQDLGMMFPTENSKQKYRYGLYKCPFCNNEFEALTNDIKSGKQKTVAGFVS